MKLKGHTFFTKSPTVILTISSIRNLVTRSFPSICKRKLLGTCSRHQIYPKTLNIRSFIRITVSGLGKVGKRKDNTYAVKSVV